MTDLFTFEEVEAELKAYSLNQKWNEVGYDLMPDYFMHEEMCASDPDYDPDGFDSGKAYDDGVKAFKEWVLDRLFEYFGEEIWALVKVHVEKIVSGFEG